jgi:S1-C subfamily serine protease
MPAWDDTGVTWLDAMLVALFVLSVIAGYRRGAVLQVLGLLGMIVGTVAGALLAPHVARLGHDPMTQVSLSLGSVIVGAAAGNVGGWILGSRLRARTKGSVLQRADAVMGSLVSVTALLLVTWFLSLNLANGPFPELARGISGSRIVQALDTVLPEPPSLLGEAQRVLSLLGFPDVFAGIPPTPADPVDPPSGAQARAAFRTAAASTFEVLGAGCYVGFLNQGSGFVVQPGYLLTNAHVVAGTSRQWIHSSDGDHDAQVVAFDPDTDLALLHVPELTAPALTLLQGDIGRGADGAVLGYPGGGPLTGDGAAVRRSFSAPGRDIYGQGEITRHLYEIQVTVLHGNSGGPFVLPDGRVAGVVFASSVIDDAVGYAIASSDVRPFVRGATGAELPVGTGTCTN